MKIFLKESQFKKLMESSSDYDDNQDLENLKIKKEELSKLKLDNMETLQRIEKLENEIDILERITSPSIYTGVAKHHTTKEPYIIARSTFRRGKNDYVELSAYVGKLKDFNGDKDSPEVMKIGKRKIQNKLAKIL